MVKGRRHCDLIYDPFSSTQYRRNTWREFYYFSHKHLLGLMNELISCMSVCLHVNCKGLVSRCIQLQGGNSSLILIYFTENESCSPCSYVFNQKHAYRPFGCRSIHQSFWVWHLDSFPLIFGKGLGVKSTQGTICAVYAQTNYCDNIYL